MSADTPTITQNPSPSPVLVMQEPSRKEATCCGRKVTSCDSVCKEAWFSIAIVIGGTLLAMGVLGLIGYYLPASSIGTMAAHVATTLGSDLLTLAIFASAIGGALVLGGGVGLAVERCQNPPVKPEVNIEDSRLKFEQI